MDRLSWRNWPLGVKFTVTLTIVVAAAVVSSTWLAIRREQETFRADLQQQAELLLDILTVATADPLYNLDVASLQNLMGALAADQSVVSGRVYDGQGRALADAYAGATFSLKPDPLGKRLIEADAEVFEWQPDQLLAGRVVTVGGQRFGAVSVGLPTKPLTTKLSAMRDQGLGVALAAVIVGTLLTLLISRSITNPLQELVRATQRIASGDLTQKVAIRGNDEITLLAGAYNNMTARLRMTIEGLEQRTRELERRAMQVAAGAEVSRVASQALDPNEMLAHVVELIRERFDLYYVAAFLVDDSGKNAVLQAGTGEAGRIMLEGGHKLAVSGNSMVGWACANNQARIALDVTAEAIRFANPLLPETRSEMALPLRLGNRVIGALDIQSKQEQAFDESDITALEGMVDHIAVAMENARLFQQSQASLKEVQRINRILTRQGWQELLASAPADFREFHQPGITPFMPEETDRLTSPAPFTQDGMVSIPLTVRNEVIGTLVVEAAPGQPGWMANELEMLKSAADQAAQAMESARLFETTQRGAIREQMTSQVTGRMRESLDVETVLRTAAAEMRQALGLDKLLVRLGTPEEKKPSQTARRPIAGGREK